MSVGSIAASSISQWSSALFSKLDTQHKGYLEKGDLQSSFPATNKASDSTGTDQLFTALDGDGDGKITATELKTGVQSLADALFGNLRQAGAQGGCGGKGAEDTGFTKDQLTAMSQDSTTDSRRADFMGKLAANFDAVDTNGDGKVSRGEAMAFGKASKTADQPGNDASSDAGVSMKLMALLKLIELSQVADTSSSDTSPDKTSGANSLSVSA